MSVPLSSFRNRNGITIPTIWVAFALSLLVHVAALWKMPKVRLPAEDPSARGPPLIVELRPPRPPPARPRPPQVERPPAPPVRPPQVEKRPPPPPIARTPPPPREIPPKGPGIALPPVPPAPGGDLASYVEARQRARGDTAPAAPVPPAAESAARAPVESDAERANRIAAANLGLDRKPAFGPDRRKSGGVFDITRMGYDYAEFLFYGWNKDIRRDTTQHIEVRKGDASDIRVAIVRRMIAIIREYEQEDFVWESKRLNRNITLSARLRDTSGLEEFLMREFFDDPRRPVTAR